MKKRISLLTVFLLTAALLLCGCKDDGGLGYDVSKYFELGQYKGITLSPMSVEVTEEEIQSQIDAILFENAEKVPVADRAVEDGDTVNIDYTGYVDGEELEGGKDTGFDLTIGSGSFIDGFEEGLIGTEIGEMVELELTFPEVYHNAELEGKDVVFYVTVNSITANILPEFNDELASKYDYPTAEAYKAAIYGQMLAYEMQNAEANRINEAADIIMQNSNLKSYPKSELNDYVTENMNYYQLVAASNYGMDLDTFCREYMQIDQATLRTQLEAEAEARVGYEMMVYAIAEAEGITVTEEDYQQGIAALLAEAGFESEEEYIEQQGASVEEVMGKEELMLNFISDKVMDLVISEAVEG